MFLPFGCVCLDEIATICRAIYMINLYYYKLININILVLFMHFSQTVYSQFVYIYIFFLNNCFINFFKNKKLLLFIKKPNCRKKYKRTYKNGLFWKL